MVNSKMFILAEVKDDCRGVLKTNSFMTHWTRKCSECHHCKQKSQAFVEFQLIR